MIKLQQLTQASNQDFLRICEGELQASSFDSVNFEFEDIDTKYDIDIDENKLFKSKFEFGEYIYHQLKPIPVIDTRVWHFLTIVYSKQLLNKNQQIGEIDRFYISSYKTFYPFTHLIKPVFDLFRFYANDLNLIKFLLLNPVNESSGMFLEIVKRQELMKNKNFIEICKKIFYTQSITSKNKSKKKHKKKQKLKNQLGYLKDGYSDGLQRLIKLYSQYERGFDLYSMPSNYFIDNYLVKHQEFDRFKPFAKN